LKPKTTHIKLVLEIAT